MNYQPPIVRPAASGLSSIPFYVFAFNGDAQSVHDDNVAAGWWTDLKTGESIRDTRNVGELLMLACSELGEAEDGYSRGLMDDKIPHRRMVEVELADAKIRILDMGGAYNLDLTGAAVALLEADYHVELWSGVPAALMAIVTEISRAMEGNRKNMATAQIGEIHLNRPQFEVGLAAALLRIHWLGTAIDCNIDAAMAEKRAFNRTRADHKIENRLKPDGKRY